MNFKTVLETAFLGARFKRDCKGRHFFEPGKFFFTFFEKIVTLFASPSECALQRLRPAGYTF